MSGRGGLFLSSSSRHYPSQVISTQLLNLIQMKLLYLIVIFIAICAVSIMIPSMAAGSVVTLFGSAPGSDDVINLDRAHYFTLFVVISDPLYRL